MKKLSSFIIVLISFIDLIIEIQTKSAYDNLLEWGKNNSLFISDKLGMKYYNENNKTYYALDDIPENTIIMNIPYELMLNKENLYKLIDSKKFEKIYTEYKNTKLGIDVGFLPASFEQSFLSFMIYYITSKPKSYQKTKFYDYFHYLLDTFETDLDSYPVFYTESQIRLLQGSLALIETTLMKELYKEESEKLSKISGKKKFDIDEYMRWRTLTITKSLNISNHTSIIPFLDMFDNDPIDFNVNFKLNETNNNLFLFTTHPIHRGNILYIRSGHFSNNKRFVIYGQTFEKMKDYIEAFQIPMISYQLQKSIVVKDENFEYDESIDLTKKKFYKKALSTYKKLAKYDKGDDSDIEGYKLFLKNLEMMREVYGYVSTSDIHKEFIKLKDINNVIRVLTFEKKFMDEKINVLKKFINKLEKEDKNKNKINKDL